MRFWKLLAGPSAHRWSRWTTVTRKAAAFEAFTRTEVEFNRRTCVDCGLTQEVAVGFIETDDVPCDIAEPVDAEAGP